MTTTELAPLIASLETSSRLDSKATADLLVALRDGMPDPTILPEGTQPTFHSTDEVMLILDAAYPNWTIKLQGRTNDKNGHWVCSLRRSDARDNDDVIGIGRAPILAHAILLAMLKLSVQKS